jgi:tartrate-resistant acid phosphatase type 5
MSTARTRRRRGERGVALTIGLIAIALLAHAASATDGRRMAQGVTSACDAAKDAVSDAKRDVRKARKALEAADTPQAKERARKKLKRAKQRLREAEAAQEDACGRVRFAVIGAQGKGNVGQSEVAAAIDAKCEASGCDYIIGLGNNIYDEGASATSSPLFAEKFETPYQNIDLPFWLGLGNHDYGPIGNDAAKAQVQVDYTAVSPSGNWKMPAKYYRRNDQHVEFFTLDTNTQMFGTDSQQETDVSGWLEDSTARWKIALGLHSYRSNGNHGNAGNYDGLGGLSPAAGVGVRDFMEDHICGQADVYFSAHDHTLQWPQEDAETCPGTELIVSATAASSTDLDETPDYPTHFQSEALGFAYVKIEDDEMTVDFIDKTGTVLFSRTVTK